MKVRVINYLVKTTYIFIFLPYLSMGLPLETDVQPFAGGFALIYIITNITKIKFSRSAVLLLIFSIFAFSWTIFIEGSGLLIIKTLAYPYGLIIYVFIYNTLDLVVVKSVIKYATIYFSVIVFQLMFPALYVLSLIHI